MTEKPSRITLEQIAEDMQLKALGGGWYELPTGEKIQGAQNAIERQKELTESIKTAYGPSALPARMQLAAPQPTVRMPRFPAAINQLRTKVAILGFTEHRAQAPFGNPEWEIWGINELWRYLAPGGIQQQWSPAVSQAILGHGFTRWFEIHDRKAIDGDKDHIGALAHFPIPVYMQKHYDDILPSVPYPKDEVERACGQGAELIWPSGRNPYFTSSIAWMLGLAILEEHFEEIHVYGVDMAQTTEYFEQRNACEYLLGLAQGLGRKIYVPQTSDLLKSVGQYGFTETGGDTLRLKLDERGAFLAQQLQAHQQELAKLDNTRAQCIAAINKISGAQEDNDYWRRSWSVSSAVNPLKPHTDRAQDPATGIQSGDGNKPAEPPKVKLAEARG